MMPSRAGRIAEPANDTTLLLPLPPDGDVVAAAMDGDGDGGVEDDGIEEAGFEETGGEDKVEEAGGEGGDGVWMAAVANGGKARDVLEEAWTGTV